MFTHHDVTILFQGMFISTFNQAAGRFEVRQFIADGHTLSLSILSITGGAVVPIGFLADLSETVQIDLQTSSNQPSSNQPPALLGDGACEDSSWLLDFGKLNAVDSVNGASNLLGTRFYITSGTLYTASMLPNQYNLVDVQGGTGPVSKPQVGAAIGIDIATSNGDSLIISKLSTNPIPLTPSPEVRYVMTVSNVRTQPTGMTRMSDFYMFYQALNIDPNDHKRYDLKVAKGGLDGFPVVCNSPYITLPAGAQTLG